MKHDEQPEVEIVRGIVLPTVWGAGGEPRLVAILTPDEGEYDVAPIAAGAELLSHLREEVEARVLVKAGRKDRRTVTVVSFTVESVLSEKSNAGHLVEANHNDEPDRGLPGHSGGGYGRK